MLEGRHVIGLFMLMLLFSGLFFTLGFVMGRNQYDGQVRAATNLRDLPDGRVLPRADVPTKPSKGKTGSDPQAGTETPPISDWEFYHAGDSSKADDRLRSVASPASAVAKKSANVTKPVNAAARTSAGSTSNAAAGVNLQVAALTKKSDALALANTLHRKNFPTFVQSPQGDKYYRVLVGPFADAKALENARKGLELAGFKAIVKH